MWGIFAHHVEAVQPGKCHCSWTFSVRGARHCSLLRLSRLRLLQVVPMRLFDPGWWWLEHVLFSIAYMGYHPSHWRTPWFFKMVIAPPTRIRTNSGWPRYHQARALYTTGVHILDCFSCGELWPVITTCHQEASSAPEQLSSWASLPREMKNLSVVPNKSLVQLLPSTV